MTGDVDSRNSNLGYIFFLELIQVLDYLVKGNTKQCQKFKLQKCVTLSIIYRLNILLVTGEFISYFRLVCFVDAILLLMIFDFLFSNKNHTCVLQKGQQSTLVGLNPQKGQQSTWKPFGASLLWGFLAMWA